MDNIDRISDLPSPILHHIMSFLSFKQVIQTSLLSKTWQRAWHSFPILEFDRAVFPPNLRFYRNRVIDIDEDTVIEEGEAEGKEKLFKLLSYMEETLHNRHKEMISVNKFTLQLFESRLKVAEPLIDRCIRYAIESDVKELKLIFPCMEVIKYGRLMKGVFIWEYNLPQQVLCSESINCLELHGCKLESPRSVKLSSLRKLCLTKVNVSDQVIKNLVAGCPLIEFLKLHECREVKYVELLGHTKLKHISIYDNKDVKRLVIEGSSVQSIDIAMPSTPHEIKIAACKNLKSLKLAGVSITDEWLCNQISKYPLLQDLILCRCVELRSVKISHRLLEQLSISSCEELRSVKISSLHLDELSIRGCKKLDELKIETPRLRIFCYEGDMVSFASDALILETKLYFYPENMDTEWYIRHNELLARFDCFSKALNLHSSNGRIAIVPEEVRRIVPSPICNAKHLNLVTTEVGGMHVGVKNALDGLLWMSPHAKNLSIKSSFTFQDKFVLKFQFSYKKKKQQPVYEGGIAQCCKSTPISCWQQCIEEVEIECSGHKLEDPDLVRRFILKGEDIWEKIDFLTDLASFF